MHRHKNIAEEGKGFYIMIRTLVIGIVIHLGALPSTLI
jgi:hypothetical protein